jgi:alanine dehydrogenase
MLLASNGWRKALAANGALLKGLNMTAGQTTYRAVAESFGLPFSEPAQFVS